MDLKRIANISVIQNGLVPITPIRPKKRLYVAVGATAGVVLGCLAAFLVDSLQRAPVKKRLRGRALPAVTARRRPAVAAFGPRLMSHRGQATFPAERSSAALAISSGIS